jgi:hypothetical protein
MKILHLFSLLAFSLCIAGCAGSTGSSGSSTSSVGATSEATSVGNEEAMSEQAGAKTAYDGSTGSGLLMERYKSGSIQGLGN